VLAVKEDPREPVLPEQGSSRRVGVLQAMIQFEELFVVLLKIRILDKRRQARNDHRHVMTALRSDSISFFESFTFLFFEFSFGDGKQLDWRSHNNSQWELFPLPFSQ